MTTEVEPRVFEAGDANEIIRYVAVHVRAPAIGNLLAAAGCEDPSPGAGKKARLRRAVEATQTRDGHSGTLVRLVALVAEAEDAERRRCDALRRAYSSGGEMTARAVVEAEDGFRLELGVMYAPAGIPRIAVRVHPDLEATPIVFNLDAAREFTRAFIAVGREVAERTPPAPPG